MFGGLAFLIDDRAPLGRNEGDPPQMWRRHDEYEDASAGPS